MRQIKTLVKKEMLDILRDKKTLIMMVVVPVLLYPLILIGMTMAMSMIMQSQEETVHTVAYEADCVHAGMAQGGDVYSLEHAAVDKSEAFKSDECLLCSAVAELERLYEENQEELDWKMKFIPAEEAGEASVRLTISEETSKKSVSQGAADTADAGVIQQREIKNSVPEPVQLNRMEKSEAAVPQLHAEITYASSSQDDRYTRQALEELLELYREELLICSLKSEGLEENFLYPITYEAVDQSSATENFGMDIGGSIGMMLIVTILLGAIYPAIDATAGEKERGTLETLLTLPVTNFQMIMSKYLSVAAFACITAIISLLSLGGSVLFLIFGFSTEMVEELQGFSIASLLSVAPMLLLNMIAMALLATAICMCFCVFAKSFKEANNYVTPVLLVVMFASMVAMIPSIHLDYKTAMIPVANVSLLVKQIISGQFDLMLAGVAALVNLGCSILLVWILAKMYDSENILFADGFRSFRIFQKRSEIIPGTVPATGDLLISITALFLLLMYVGSAASVHLGFWGTAVSQLLILIVPLLILWYMKSDKKQLLSFNVPVLKYIPGSVFLYIGTYCLVMAISSVLTWWMAKSTQNLNKSFEVVMEQPFWILLLVIAVMPAIGEEILFRGFLMGSLKERLGGKWALFISALVFGVFHMSLVKLLPTALLGASFAYIVQRTGSICVSMALHFINNAISILIMKYPEKAMKLIPVLAKEQLAWSESLIVASVGIILAGVGILLLRKGREAK